jgi:hypothetical protein
VTRPLLSPVRPFAYAMSFTGEAHKSITGSYTFLNNNIEENVGALKHHTDLTGCSAVYVVLSRRLTPVSRTIIKKICVLEVENFATVYNWLKEKNPIYAELPEMSNCPSPTLFEDEPDINNSDESDCAELEKEVNYHYWFPSNGEPNKSTATFLTQNDFMKIYIQAVSLP